MTHRSVRRCIAPRPVGCCTDSRPESRGPIHRAQARDGPSLAENHNNACQFHEPPRAASADRRPGQDPAGRPCDRSVHRPLLAALPGTAPSRSRPADGADGAGALFLFITSFLRGDRTRHGRQTALVAILGSSAARPNPALGVLAYSLRSRASEGLTGGFGSKSKSCPVREVFPDESGDLPFPSARPASTMKPPRPEQRPAVSRPSLQTGTRS